MARLGWIYFLMADPTPDDEEAATLVKIGFASNPDKRIYDVQTASPLELDVIDVFRGTDADEAMLHRMLAPLRVRGEWFRFEDEIDELINDLADYRIGVWLADKMGAKMGRDELWSGLDEIPVSPVLSEAPRA